MTKLLVLALHVFGAGVEGALHERILIDLRRVDVDLALLLEHPRHGVRRAEVAAEARHLGADFGDGARRVVGHGVDEERDAAGAVALVRHFLVVDALELTRALLDRALDVLLRHRAAARRVDGETEPRISGRITAAELGGHGDFANELREQRATLLVSRGLVVLDLLPFTMASHKPIRDRVTLNIQSVAVLAGSCGRAIATRIVERASKPGQRRGRRRRRRGLRRDLADREAAARNDRRRRRR